ncbi:MAG TPA: hypothetical protein VLW85_13600 [Myxococcales bacterium]|nr:hypothetical protein [Myxococcales bacterium]
MRSAVLLMLVACTPQADSGYLGEPLVSLRGQVVSSGDLPSLEAAMLWQRGDPPSTTDEELATLAPVQTGFPATFTVHLYQPAPAAARRTLAPGEPVWARANAAAVPAGTPSSVVALLGGLAGAPTVPAASGQYGIDPDHWVMYLASDVPRGSLTEWWLGAALPAGFHLIDVAVVNPSCIAADELSACVADLRARGVASDDAAKAFCLAPYRLSPAADGEELKLQLGTVGLASGGGSCP